MNPNCRYESLTVRCFKDSELAQALQFYRTSIAEGFTPNYSDFKSLFRCSTKKAEMLHNAAAWAYRVQEKEKAQLEAKRKRAC